MSKELDKVNEIYHYKAIHKADGTTVIESSLFNLLVAYAKQALRRLEAIDNANPSEALKCILDIKNNYKFYVHNKKDIDYQCNTIKQALLKAQENVRSEEILQKYYQEGITLDSVRALREENAELRQKTQEPKHYLKWEDLEFNGNNEYSYFKVKLGDNVYKAFSYFSYVFNKDTVVIKTYNQIAITEDNKQFFNDLHLERVEE